MYQGHYFEFYDAFMRNRGKEYEEEARSVARIVRELNPRAASLLDVACGTGLHLEHFVAHFPRVHGSDRSERMLRAARARVPDDRAEFAVRDMRDIGLERGFDAVVCLFAVSHLASAEELSAAVASMADHLAPGGVVVVEPWYSPDTFLPGYVARDVVEVDGTTLVRLSHTAFAEGSRRRVTMRVHHLSADAPTGIRHGTETTEMTLFEPEDFRRAFARAGCSAELVAAEPFARGLWVARRENGAD